MYPSDYKIPRNITANNLLLRFLRLKWTSNSHYKFFFDFDNLTLKLWTIPKPLEILFV